MSRQTEIPCERALILALCMAPSITARELRPPVYQSGRKAGIGRFKTQSGICSTPEPTAVQAGTNGGKRAIRDSVFGYVKRSDGSSLSGLTAKARSRRKIANRAISISQ